MTEEVVLHVYDLSLGSLSHLSKSLLGQQVDGFWHTGIVLFGYEYFYGKTIHRKRPEDFANMFGHPPIMTFVLGKTDVGKRRFEGHITSGEFQEKYSQEKYDVLRNNCNDFCRDALKFALPDQPLSEDVEEVLNNANIIASSPRVQTFLGLFHNGKRLGLNFVAKLMEKANIPSDKEAIKNVLDIFSKPSALAGEEREINLDDEEEEEESEMDISPEAAISGILDFFESLSTNQKMKTFERTEDDRGGRRKTRLPPGTKEVAVNFGKNLVEAIKLINQSISQAVKQPQEDGQPSVAKQIEKKQSKAVIQSKQSKASFFKEVEEEEKTEIVPLTPEVEEFLNSTFESNYEAIVVKTVKSIFEKNGYYEMTALRGISEQELIQMGVKRGWAKKLKVALDKYFL